jgi:hypothetical protein
MSNETGPSQTDAPSKPAKARSWGDRHLGWRRLFWLIAGVGIGILATPATAYLALLSMGAGHGDYRFFTYFYPGLLLLMMYRDGLGESTMEWWGLLQFPIYGLIIGLCNGKRRAALVGGLLLTLHLAAVCVLFWPVWWG